LEQKLSFETHIGILPAEEMTAMDLPSILSEKCIEWNISPLYDICILNIFEYDIYLLF